MLRTLMALLTALAVGLSASHASAVTHTWQGPGSSMNSPANWLGAVVPTSGDTNLTLVIPAGANSSPIQDIASPLSLESLQIGASSGYSYSGNAYQFNNLGAAPTITIGNNAYANFLAPLDFNAPTTMTIGDSAFVEFYSPLSGSDLTINSTATSLQPNIYFQNPLANTLGGTTTLSGFFTASLNSPANVAALGGDLVVAGLNNSQFGRLVASGANQIAAGTNVAAVNFGRVELYAPHTFNNLEVSTGSFLIISSSLTVQGDILSNGGIATINGGTLDLNGQFKTVNTTLGGPSDVLSISSAITNGRINKIGPGQRLHRPERR